jgi:hypothetical protein
MADSPHVHLRSGKEVPSLHDHHGGPISRVDRSRMGRAVLQRAAQGGHASRRALRRAGGVGGPARGDPGVLPAAQVTRVSVRRASRCLVASHEGSRGMGSVRAEGRPASAERPPHLDPPEHPTPVNRLAACYGPTTRVGFGRSVVVPSPSWPYGFQPQQ